MFRDWRELEMDNLSMVDIKTIERASRLRIFNK
jgi:hypothetical protein